MSLVTTYLKGVQKHFSTREKEQFCFVHGATPDDIEELKTTYPLCPDSVIEFLSIVDGTNGRIYNKDYVDITVLADLEQYPHSLLSVQEILKERDYDETTFKRYMDDTVTTEDSLKDFVDIDPKVDVNISLKHALCFSVGINGSACLYIDFNPTQEGKIGQIISYEHDPDLHIVIADNFDEYLQLLINQDFSFMTEKDDDE
ncbi:unnamed protein product [Commensalibacter communis]|nr:unnamed protein product [Commensalibacter communis]